MFIKFFQGRLIIIIIPVPSLKTFFMLSYQKSMQIMKMKKCDDRKMQVKKHREMSCSFSPKLALLGLIDIAMKGSWWSCTCSPATAKCEGCL